jgi:hypothetical protein
MTSSSAQLMTKLSHRSQNVNLFFRSTLQQASVLRPHPCGSMRNWEWSIPIPIPITIPIPICRVQQRAPWVPPSLRLSLSLQHDLTCLLSTSSIHYVVQYMWTDVHVIDRSHSHPSLVAFASTPSGEALLLSPASSSSSPIAVQWWWSDFCSHGDGWRARSWSWSWVTDERGPPTVGERQPASQATSQGKGK